MQINNITNCCKPRHPRSILNFSSSSNLPSEKVKYKHFEQMDDDTLSAISIIKAHKSVENSSKMRLYKAIPALTTGIIATSLAITQPGKLSAKAATGLGFLAAATGIDFILNKFSKLKEQTQNTSDNNKKSMVKTGLAMAGISAAAVGLIKGKNTQTFKSVDKFIKSEASKLANEIDSTKIAKIHDKFSPIIDKHQKIASSGALLTSVAAAGFSGIAKTNLLKSLSKDIKTKANENFEHGKKIQEIARSHFDSIDAVEV